MKTYFLAFVITMLTIAYSCRKTHTPTPPPLTPAVAEGYFTGRAWAFTTNSNDTHPPIFDSVQFFFRQQVSANVYVDSIAAYYPGRLVIFTTGTFTVSNVYNAPDTLVSLFSPYTAAGSQVDTFLVNNLSDKLFTIQRYSVVSGYGAQQDTLVRR